ncbi:hybrid sensor histidine kinase/response regulator [Thalassovita taeanensis]|uniref:histidine kinase n=1 Tax=Thalassovita taeanensis TaxID=657014 RepID=A0A1H8ZKL4_9RHOB|nr:ATP-binding protein [Thalassovita taeanensis]SEP64793.1 two-component system, cell cycle sensor histidine kinase and response regulator CckA [Thalassovita taeanensis]
MAQFSLVLAGLGVACLIGALRYAESSVGLALMAAGASMIAMVVLTQVVRAAHRLLRRRTLAQVAGFVEHDAAASFVTDVLGTVVYFNSAARAQFDLSGQTTLASVLQEVFANPSGVLMRLQARADAEAGATEDVVTRRGHIRLNVHRVRHDGYLWRVEVIGEGQVRARSGVGSGLPMLTVGRGGTILFMNDAARQFVGERTRTLDRIFPELPLRLGKENRVSGAAGVGRCMVHEAPGSAGRREVYFMPVQKEALATEASKAALDALPVAVLRLGSEGEILMSNRLARDLLGIPDTDGRWLPQMMEGLGRSITDWLDDAAMGRGLNASEFLRLKRTDREVFVQVSLNRVHDAEGKALIAVLHDATELKSLEAQFVQSQKMQAIGELAGGVAHDFNNLLTAISGHCDLLLLRHDQGDPDYGDLVQINQNANRAAALVGQLLAFSRKQTLRPEVLDMRETLADLTHLLNRLVGEKVTLSLSHDPAPRTIRADKRQLEQVLMNLVVNARDAMPTGGDIRIETETRGLSEPIERDRAVVPVGEYVAVCVSDDGCGIAPDRLQKVFEPFYTTKRTGEGTGLGLSTVYGIVKQSGGFIFVDSVLGRGTCFTLLFPVYEGKEALSPVEGRISAPVAARHGDGVVLLVEDEAPVRAFASRALRLRGYTVIEAESAEDALSVLQDPELSVDIFVTDVIMPGMDGPTWVREALKDRPGARVVFVSGYAEDAFDDSSRRIPNSVFLPKPFSLNDLTETVQRQLH